MNRKMTVGLVAILIASGMMLSSASAHYLWITVDVKAGKHGTANIYFEGGPGAGDGKYLDPFVSHGKTWIHTVEAGKPKLIKTSVVKKPGKRWLSVELPAGAPRSIDSFGKWGVYRYGKTDVLLHYYARYLHANSHDSLHELARAKHLDLDLVLHEANGAIEIKVLWKGKPAAGRPVYIRGPKGFKKNAKSNKRGIVSFKATADGRYTFRSYVEEKDRSGTDNGKIYQMARHHVTLITVLPVRSK